MTAKVHASNRLTVFESTTYQLEVQTCKVSGLVSLNFLVTYPQASFPQTVRKAQFNLPPEAITALCDQLGRLK